METFIIIMFEAGAIYYWNNEKDRWVSNLDNATKYTDENLCREDATTLEERLPYPVEYQELSTWIKEQEEKEIT